MLSYLITLRSEQVGHVIQTLVGPNETEVKIGPQNGLRASQTYEYAVTAINIIGNASSKWGIISHTSKVLLLANSSIQQLISFGPLCLIITQNTLNNH